ncbi:Lrp/AsnC family transcriptional regulator [Candidatus Bathyarchaeota archaeon]|nr:Lrp/AsnC family transcriptional regulator [Candidatus Bathyarchaeota archaeon]
MVTAFVMIRVGTGEVLDFERVVKEEIKKMKEVKTVYSVFGRYDLIAQATAPTLEDLSRLADKIRAVAGVLSTESLIVHT